MASKYSQKFPVPEGFGEVLHDFTREILRDQPEDIIEYAAAYFDALHKKQPFHYESKYNVKPEKNEPSHYVPKPRQNFDPINPPKRGDSSREVDGLKSPVSHKEEKSIAREYVNGLSEGILGQVNNTNDDLRSSHSQSFTSN